MSRCYSCAVAETLDRWAQWLLDRRFGGDQALAERAKQRLGRVRARVLDGANVRPGDVVLDVGAGDGLIAFGALERVGDDGRVVFSDISQDLLDHSRALAEELGVADRCEFVLAAAEDLVPVANASVDVVTTRSVLIYVEDKQRAFESFFRVLRPGGRVSMFEPINRFHVRNDPNLFWGYDVGPVRELARKVDAFYEATAPGENTLVDFDERDLLELAEQAGFARIELDYEARIQRDAGCLWDADAEPSWERFVNVPGNPLAPSLAEAMDQALSPDERAAFEAYLRPLVEGAKATERSAVAYFRATKR